MYAQNYCRLVSCPPLRFLLLTLGMCELAWSRPLLPQTMQVASVPLGLVSTQAPLISHGARSVLSESRGSRHDCRICMRVLKTTRNRGRGRMHETNWIFEQTPPPHFCLKVVCKKGGHVFRSLRYHYWIVTKSALSVLSSGVSAIQGFLMHWSVWRNCWDFQNCLFNRGRLLLRGIH